MRMKKMLLLVLSVGLICETASQNTKQTISHLIKHIDTCEFYSVMPEEALQSYILQKNKGELELLIIEHIINPDFPFNHIKGGQDSTLTCKDMSVIKQHYEKWWRKMKKYSMRKIKSLRNQSDPLYGTNYSWTTYN